MTNYTLKIVLAALALMLLFSCSSDTTKKEKRTKVNIVNPNGDSELALNMRKIFDQTEDIKISLNEGYLDIPPNYINNIKSFHTSIPTDPDVKIERFFQFTNALEIAAKELSNQSTLEKQKTQYKRIVNTCIQCHQNFCPGPIRRINKLKLPRIK